jgi:hypothetical protein
MDLLKMITELQAERDRLDEAIQALERLSASGKLRRRGRPPRWLKEEIERQAASGAAEKESAESK